MAITNSSASRLLLGKARSCFLGKNLGSLQKYPHSGESRASWVIGEWNFLRWVGSSRTHRQQHGVAGRWICSGHWDYKEGFGWGANAIHFPLQNLTQRTGSIEMETIKW